MSPHNMDGRRKCEQGDMKMGCAREKGCVRKKQGWGGEGE